ncbi:MAG: hypothetical protein ABI041_10850, partial [Bdellovibrionia bacterium]
MSKLVFVDVDDTILSPPYEAMRKVLKTIGRRFPTEEEVLNRKHIDFFDSYPDIFRTKTQMWLSVFLSLLFGYFRSQKLLKFDKENLGEQLKDNRVYLISKNPPSFTRWRVLRLKALLGVNVGDRYIACGPIFKKGKKKIEII